MRLLFDRGTILLRDVPGSVDLSDLPGVLWDPRVRALRAPGRHHPAIRDELARRGVRFSDEVCRAADEVGPWAEMSLRPYQDAAHWAWQAAGRRGVVVLPTGAGKTRLAIAAMARTRRPALALVPTRVLLAQWVREIASAFGGAVGCLGDGERRVEAITVATFESGWRQMDRLGNRFELLVVDEAHHFGSGVRDEALELCAAPARLGLTATPPSGAAGERIEELIGPTVFELSVGDLTGRYLSPFQLVTLSLELDQGERAAWLRAVAVYLVREPDAAPCQLVADRRVMSRRSAERAHPRIPKHSRQVAEIDTLGNLAEQDRPAVEDEAHGDGPSKRWASLSTPPWPAVAHGPPDEIVASFRLAGEKLLQGRGW